MSMHEIEDFVEGWINSVASSPLPVQEKWNLIYTLFELESYGDCGFTNARTVPAMVENQYTFLFDKEQMYDYGISCAFYDEEQFVQDSYGQGDLYPYRGNHFSEEIGKLCVDSGSPAWEGMVRTGKITGEGATPVRRLGTIETLRTVKALIEAQYGPLDNYYRSALC